MTLSLIIPLKNEDNVIKNTLRIIEESWITQINHEVILIDDFSNDRTWDIISNYKSDKIKVKFFKNETGGIGSAISLGIKNSENLYVAIFMSDLSDSLDDLKKYYDMISTENLDAILGSRFIKGSSVNNYPLLKYTLNRTANTLIGLAFFNRYNDYTNAFKIYKRNVLDELQPIVSQSFNIFLELSLKIISRKYDYKIIPISWNGRKLGESKFKIDELGAKYIFTFFYCYLEKILIKKKKLKKYLKN